MLHEAVRGSILILSLGIGPDRSGMHFADPGYGSIAQIAQRGHTSRVVGGGRRGAKSGQSFACGPQQRPASDLRPTRDRVHLDACDRDVDVGWRCAPAGLEEDDTGHLRSASPFWISVTQNHVVVIKCICSRGWPLAKSGAD